MSRIFSGDSSYGRSFKFEFLSFVQVSGDSLYVVIIILLRNKNPEFIKIFSAFLLTEGFGEGEKGFFLRSLSSA